MGRRTAWWRAGAWRGRRPSARARGAVVAAALLCTTAALPSPLALAAPTPDPYTFATDARSVSAATTTADAEPLTLGETYKSSLPSSGKTYYRLDLDAAANAYVSATAVPSPGSTVSASDGIRVTVQDADSRLCSHDSEIFGSVRSPRPIAAWGWREVSSTRPRCEKAGTYYVVVERTGTAASAPDTWDLELFAASEPPLTRTGTTGTPGAWDSASPAPLTGKAVWRAGGAGFATATSVGQGSWRHDVTPGRTLFYKVPVSWGQQLYATAELGSSSAGSRLTPSALNLSLYNPVRGFVDDANASYDGSQKSADLDPLPPVAYGNRFAGADRVSGMRFAGSYYLVVHLSTAVAERFGDGPLTVTLRVQVQGTAQAEPGYAGQPKPAGIFGRITPSDPVTSARGGAAGAGGDALMEALAVGGLGAGTLLLVVLGVWTVAARRGAR
ncbi:hypothetical protein [Streptomyces dysideae]|uniref:Peptidase n=1 Tax=Streptomyces dysideae TaxID=909626 RepID=A0A101V2S2_9ACTN|nr:hypothetical protein [Streptomyces dysideae]KUO21460.1 hypothetical protein AQJ91_08980 [Streptomyces dysideae]